MKFSDIPAHDSVKQQLVEMVDNNRIPHALLLEGKSGIGKMMLARALHNTYTAPADTTATVAACVRRAFSTCHSTISTPTIHIR